MVHLKHLHTIMDTGTKPAASQSATCCGNKETNPIGSHQGKRCCDDDRIAEGHKHAAPTKTKPCCQHEGDTGTTPRTRCIGVVVDDCMITIFDADGVSRHYQCDSSTINEICFLNHGMDGSLLTPCFDDSGRHEDIFDCFCGEDAQHLHAHLKSMCEAPDRLAQTILYQVDVVAVKGHNIPISPAMPGVCSSRAQSPGEGTHHRIFPQSINHGDSHLDDLVLNEMTGELYLGNHDCKICEICLHGKFQTIGSRSLEFGAFSIYAIPKESFQKPSKTVRSSIHCGGICCAAEIPEVRVSLEATPGVHSFFVNVTLKQVTVDHDPKIIAAQDLLQRLSGVGATEVLKDGGAMNFAEATTVQSKLLLKGPISDASGTCPLILSYFYDETTDVLTVTHVPLAITASQIAKQLGATVIYDGTEALLQTNRESDSDKIAKQRFPRPTVILSGILWIISMLSLIGGAWSHLKWVALVSILFGIPPIAFKALQSLQRLRFDTNCLMFFASVGAIGLQDFTEAAAVVFLFALSEWLELRASSRARTALLSIIELRPEVAVAIVQGDLVNVPSAMVPVGTLVSVKAGDKVPCDGVVEVGTTLIDESSLTGESRPISKIPGCSVSGGTVNCGVSPLTVKTTATADNSAVSRLIRLVEEAQGNRSATEKV